MTWRAAQIRRLRQGIGILQGISARDVDGSDPLAELARLIGQS